MQSINAIRDTGVEFQASFTSCVTRQTIFPQYVAASFCGRLAVNQRHDLVSPDSEPLYGVGRRDEFIPFPNGICDVTNQTGIQSRH